MAPKRLDATIAKPRNTAEVALKPHRLLESLDSFFICTPYGFGGKLCNVLQRSIDGFVAIRLLRAVPSYR
jgi:hypothetical protein